MDDGLENGAPPSGSVEVGDWWCLCGRGRLYLPDLLWFLRVW
jgi:hypothetical protein